MKNTVLVITFLVLACTAATPPQQQSALERRVSSADEVASWKWSKGITIDTGERVVLAADVTLGAHRQPLCSSTTHSFRTATWKSRSTTTATWSSSSAHRSDCGR